MSSPRTSRCAALINVRDLADIQSRRPVLVAHRGGVIAGNAPENSLAGLQRAAEQGYDMIELDVRRAKDGEPVVYHGWSGSLRMDCGVDETAENLTSKELQGIHYRTSDQHIPTLEEALHQCASLNLGVMLDLKVSQKLQAHAFFERIGELLGKYHLTDSAVTISFHPLVREHLADTVVCRVIREDLQRVKAGQAVSLEGQFWFSAADELPPELVKPLQDRGAFIIPALNTFLYPTHAHYELAQQDALRFQQAGVEGFQLDSVYGRLFAEEIGC